MLWKNNQFFTDIPFPKVKDRPLIVAHPGAHMNYLASWNVMVDNEAPFVLVCDDLSPAYPDGWWSSHSQNNSEYFARISNPQGIGQAYRNPDLGFQNLLIHREMEAKKGLKDYPFIDIMYIDFPEIFLEGGFDFESKEPVLLQAASLLSSKIRDEGLLIFDLKNASQDINLPKGLIEINEDISWEYMGKAEWFIIPKGVDLFHSGNQDVQAVIYKVRNNNKFPDCFDFLASLMKERRLSIDELENIKHLPPRWPFHIHQSEYIDAWLRHAEFGGNEPFLHPMPLDSAWKEEEYKEWILWLLQHPEQLRPQERNERKMKIGEVDVTFVHGDILDHLDWLESINASLVLRRKLLTKCLEKSPYLIKNSVNLQPRWDINPIPNLTWSGTKANQDLTKIMMELCITDTMATISHHDGSVESLIESLRGMIKTSVKELIIFHKDGEDYAEV
ncbi:MAG: hypothetical protein VXY42_02470 [Candidatus Thermoplasmatota archaeon]|nr:hypothetical protein [Candidatus Thermoplasmatota archaeon]